MLDRRRSNRRISPIHTRERCTRNKVIDASKCIHYCSNPLILQQQQHNNNDAYSLPSSPEPTFETFDLSRKRLSKSKVLRKMAVKRHRRQDPDRAHVNMEQTIAKVLRTGNKYAKEEALLRLQAQRESELLEQAQAAGFQVHFPVGDFEQDFMRSFVRQALENFVQQFVTQLAFMNSSTHDIPYLPQFDVEIGTQVVTRYAPLLLSQHFLSQLAHSSFQQTSPFHYTPYLDVTTDSDDIEMSDSEEEDVADAVPIAKTSAPVLSDDYEMTLENEEEAVDADSSKTNSKPKSPSKPTVSVEDSSDADDEADNDDDNNDTKPSQDSNSKDESEGYQEDVVFTDVEDLETPAKPNKELEPESPKDKKSPVVSKKRSRSNFESDEEVKQSSETKEEVTKSSEETRDESNASTPDKPCKEEDEEDDLMITAELIRKRYPTPESPSMGTHAL